MKKMFFSFLILLLVSCNDDDNPVKQPEEITLLGYEKVLKDSLAHADQVTDLDLSHYDMPYLTDDIGKFKNLHVLMLNNNRLSNLPDAIRNCNELNLINLNFNEFDSIPEQLLSLSVSYLFASNNKINELSPRVFNRDLTQLDLRNNYLKSIPDSIRHEKNLKLLDLSNNFLENLPNEIFTLQKLRNLRISGNQLSQINNHFNLPELYEFSIYDNRLKNIPTGIVNSTKLEILYIFNNELEKMPDNLNKLKNLKLFFAWGNKFSQAEKERIMNELPDDCMVMF